MTDIAHKAGVSRATVSLVLSGKDMAVGIAEETRQRVRTAAEELGYRPNQIARAMVTGKNPVLGFLVNDPSLEVAARILGGVIAEAESGGYFVKVIGYGKSFDKRIIEQCVELRLAGVMSLYVYGSAIEYLHEEMARFDTPVAVIDSSFPQARGIRIISDDKDGIRQAIAHLTALGHRRIAFISGHRSSGAACLRAEGYRTAMAEHGLEVPEGYLVDGDWSIPTTEQVTAELLRHPAGRPTALCCADDKTAMIACRVAWQSGLSIPRDISVIGFANLGMAAFAYPPLTTVAQPFDTLGRAAVRHLLNPEVDKEKPIEELLPTQLIVRESTGPVHRDMVS